MDYLFLPMNLQLFAEGGAAAGGEGGAEGTGVTAPSPEVQTKGAKNPLANVRYGKQPEDTAPAAEVQTEPDTKAEPEKPVDKHAEFEAMIKGDYKEAYDKRVQSTIQKRLKSANETQQRYEALQPLLDLLGAKYGVDSTDAEALYKAAEEDDGFFEAAAVEKNMSVKDYKQMLKLQSENNRLKAQKRNWLQQEMANQQYAIWMNQAEEAKKIYPSLDLSEESQNPKFRKLLDAGVDVESAYFIVHKDDVIAGAMQHTAKTVEQKLANNMAAGGKRPSENGMNSQSAAVIKRDPSTWTKADRMEVRRRAARGENIVL